MFPEVKLALLCAILKKETAHLHAIRSDQFEFHYFETAFLN